jgi:hypothetical protein
VIGDVFKTRPWEMGRYTLGELREIHEYLKAKD